MTESLHFDHSTVYISSRSPYARRVRLALEEHHVPFTEKVFDVFKFNPELIAVNPLARVPVVQLKSGQILLDSNLILQTFYEYTNSSFIPKSLKERIEVYRWAGISNGLLDQVIQVFLDSLRPQEYRDPVLKSELVQTLDHVLPILETRLSENAWMVGAGITQADLDITTSLTYTVLRYSDEWKKHFPAVDSYLKKMEDRPAFKRTFPPR